jgi:hypothetical protein
MVCVFLYESYDTTSSIYSSQDGNGGQNIWDENWNFNSTNYNN